MRNNKEEENTSHIQKEELGLYSTSSAAGMFKPHEIKGTSFKIRNGFKTAPFVLEKNKKNKRPVIKVFLLVALCLLVLSILYAGYKLFFSESRTNFIDRHIDMSLTTSAFSRGGENLPLMLKIQNRNSVALKNVHLEILYPRGSVAESRDDYEIITMDLSDTNPGALLEKNIPVILYGAQGSKKEITATIEYTLPDSSLTYTKTSKAYVTMSSSPIVISFDAPKDTVPNQLFSGRLRIIQNTETMPESTLATIVFPRDFKIESFSKAPDFDTGTWAVTTKKNGDFQEITFTGRFTSLEGEERTFLTSVGVPKTSSGTNIYTSYVNQTHTVTLGRPFLDGYLLLGTEKQKAIAVKPGSQIEGEIVWKNRSNFSVVNPTFSVKVQGNALSEKDIYIQNGYYDSRIDSLVWTADTDPTLARIEPGSEGRLLFNVVVLPNTLEKIVKEPSIVFALSISGTKDDGSFETMNLENIELASVRVTTEPSLYSGIVFARGSNPPKAEKESVYQITLGVKNTYNEIAAGKVVAKLPFYVSWVGKVTKDEKIAYNPDTREVIWTVNNIAANVGQDGSPKREAVFQVSITPFLSQVGNILDLVTDINFKGTDIFSNKDVRTTYKNVTTRIREFTSGDGVVVE